MKATELNLDAHGNIRKQMENVYGRIALYAVRTYFKRFGLREPSNDELLQFRDDIGGELYLAIFDKKDI